MSFDKELLEILACPQCKGELTLTPEEDGLALLGTLFRAKKSQLHNTQRA